MKLTAKQFKEHSQKVREGQAKTNKKIGRPPKLPKDRIIELRKFKTVEQIAKDFNVSRQAIYNILKNN